VKDFIYREQVQWVLFTIRTIDDLRGDEIDWIHEDTESMLGKARSALVHDLQRKIEKDGDPGGLIFYGVNDFKDEQ